MCLGTLLGQKSIPGCDLFHIPFVNTIRAALEKLLFVTGKSVSEALILQSINPQYDDRLFIDSWLQYKKNTTSEHVVYKHCFLFLFWSSKQCLYTTCSEVVFFLYWIQEWMNNLSSYCGLTDSRISASEKDLPVHKRFFLFQGWNDQWRWSG